jgi:hypothetical protein
MLGNESSHTEIFFFKILSLIHRPAKLLRTHLSRRPLSMVAFAGAIMVIMISFALVTVQYGRSESAVHGSLSSSSEFSSGMPLP